MKGDFTRDTFDPLKHFSRVLMQQGRVTLDADHNEQTASLLHYLRRLARDIIGPYAAPAEDGGFRLQLDQTDIFGITTGCYYVDGILVENDAYCTYRTQPDFPLPTDDALLLAKSDTAERTFWVYLDVWERHITAIEDGSIREKALNGPDTCTRAKVVWQVKALLAPDELEGPIAKALKEIQQNLDSLYKKRIELQNAEQTRVTFLKLQAMDEQLARLNRSSLLPLHKLLLGQLVRLSKATLAARVDPGLKTKDVCVTAPDAKYRGVENHLYRVEIHRGGKVTDQNPPTFKWSRDNGSVVTAWLGTNGSDLQVTSARGFSSGDWVELSDDDSELRGLPGTLVPLAKIEGDVLSVAPGTTLPTRPDDSKRPKVRRWDQQTENPNIVFMDGAVKIQEPAVGGALWIDLEDGVQIQFGAGGEYRTGDYWLIPARVATGNIEWPQDRNSNPQPLPPHGVEHNYAVLGMVTFGTEGAKVTNERCEFWPLLSCVTEAATQGDRVIVSPMLGSPKTVAQPVNPEKAPKRRKRAGSGPSSVTGGRPK